MSTDLSPEEAAAIAQGDDAAQAATEAAETATDTAEKAAEGAADATAETTTEMPVSGPLSALKEAALHTEPDTPLEQIESLWDPDKGGERRIQRGIRKMTGYDGVPAVVDVVIGAAEMAFSERGDAA